MHPIIDSKIKTKNSKKQKPFKNLFFTKIRKIENTRFLLVIALLLILANPVNAGFKDFAQSKATYVASSAQGLFVSLISVTKSAGEGIKSGSVVILDKISCLVSEAGLGAKNFVNDCAVVAGNIKNVAKNTALSAGQGVSSTFSFMGEKVENATASVGSGLSNGLSTISRGAQAGAEGIKGVTLAVSRKVGEISSVKKTEAVKPEPIITENKISILDKINGGVADFVGQFSYSVVNIAEGTKNGIKNITIRLGSVTKSAANSVSDIFSNLPRTIAGLFNASESMGNDAENTSFAVAKENDRGGIVQGLKEKASDIGRAAVTVTESVVSGVGEGLQNIGLGMQKAPTLAINTYLNFGKEMAGVPQYVASGITFGGKKLAEMSHTAAFALGETGSLISQAPNVIIDNFLGFGDEMAKLPQYVSMAIQKSGTGLSEVPRLAFAGFEEVGSVLTKIPQLAVDNFIGLAKEMSALPQYASTILQKSGNGMELVPQLVLVGSEKVGSVTAKIPQYAIGSFLSFGKEMANVPQLASNGLKVTAEGIMAVPVKVAELSKNPQVAFNNFGKEIKKIGEVVAGVPRAIFESGKKISSLAINSAKNSLRELSFKGEKTKAVESENERVNVVARSFADSESASEAGRAVNTRHGDSTASSEAPIETKVAFSSTILEKAKNINESIKDLGRDSGKSLQEIFVESPKTIFRFSLEGVLSLADRVKRLEENTRLALLGRKVQTGNELAKVETSPAPAIPSTAPVETKTQPPVIIKQIIEKPASTQSVLSRVLGSTTVDGVLVVNGNTTLKGNEVKIIAPLALENSFTLGSVFSIDQASGDMVLAGDFDMSNGKLSARDLDVKGIIDFKGAKIDFTGATITGFATSGGTVINNYYSSTNISSGSGASIAGSFDALSIGGDATIGGALAITGGANFNSDVTIGNASSDTLTINASSVSVPNGLTFSGGNVIFGSGSTVSSTFTGNISVNGTGTSTLLYGATIATSGGNVGIGTTSPLAKLHIAGTGDSKQLVVSGYSTQTSNPFEYQNSSGVPLAWINSAGGFGASGTSYFSNILPAENNTYNLGSYGNSWKDVYVSGTIYSTGAVSSTNALSLEADYEGALLYLRNNSSASSTHHALVISGPDPTKWFEFQHDGNNMFMETNEGSGSNIYIHPDGGQVFVNTDLIVSGGAASVMASGRANFTYDPTSTAVPALWLSTSSTYGYAKTYFAINPDDTVDFDRYLHFRNGNYDRLVMTKAGSFSLYPDNVLGFAVRASSTQTANLIEGQNSSGMPVFYVSSAGNVGVSGTLTVDGAISNTSALFGTGAATGTVTIAGTSPWLTIGNGTASTTLGGYSVTATSTHPYGINLATLGGNVGIGTTNPGAAKLDVVGILRSSMAGGSSNYVSMAAGDSNGTLASSDGLILQTGSSNYMYLRSGSGGIFMNDNNSNDIQMVNGGGRVAIGTTAPTSTFTVAGASPWFTLGNGTASTTIGGYSLTATSTHPYGINLATLGGNVGIGTASPAQTLHVVGNGFVSSKLGVGIQPGALDVAGTFWVGDSNASMRFFETGGINYIQSTGASQSGSGELRFSNMAANNIWMTLNTSGMLGIGTTNPSDKLTVAGGNLVIGGGTSTTTLTYGNRGSATSTFYSDLWLPNRDVLIGGSSGAGNLWIGNGGATTSIVGGLAGLATSTFEGDVSISNLYMGSIEFAVDNGLTDFVNAPISSSATTGTLQGGAFLADGIPSAIWGCIADALGSCYNWGLGVNTSTLYTGKSLSVQGDSVFTGSLFSTASTTLETSGTSTFFSALSDDSSATKVFSFNISSAKSTAKLLSILEAGTELAYFDASGGLYAPSSTFGGTSATGMVQIGNGAGTTTLTGGVAGSATSTFVGDVVISNLYSGILTFGDDAGLVDSMDIGVSSGAATGTAEGYSFLVDGLPVAAVKGTSDALGSVWDLRFELTNNLGTATTTIRGAAGATSTFAGSIAAANTVTANCSGACLDIAEQYKSLDIVEAGDVVVSAYTDVIPTGMDAVAYNSSLVKKSNSAYASNVVGIVSTNPAFVMSMEGGVGMGGGGAGSADKPNIALAGRVPVKVTNENGEIKKGDYLVTSALEPGRAMKYVATSTASEFVSIFAMALEDWSPDTAIDSTVNSGVKLNKMTVLVKNVLVRNNNFGESLTIEEKGADIVAPEESFDFAGKNLINIKSLASVSGTWSLSEAGEFVAESVKAKIVSLSELIVLGDKETSDAGEELDPAIGNSFIKSDEHIKVVYNNRVKKNSQVFVTFRDNTGGPWWISNQGDGFFEVSVPAAMGYNIRFSYWIVGVEGGDKDSSKPVGYDGSTQDSIAPEITSVVAGSVSETGATINWSTNEDSDSVIVLGTFSVILREYSTEESLIQSTSDFTKSHSINLNDLVPDTTYYFKVKSTDVAGNEAESQEYSFKTSALVTVVPPAQTPPPAEDENDSSGSSDQNNGSSGTDEGASDTTGVQSGSEETGNDTGAQTDTGGTDDDAVTGDSGTTGMEESAGDSGDTGTQNDADGTTDTGTGNATTGGETPSGE